MQFKTAPYSASLKTVMALALLAGSAQFQMASAQAEIAPLLSDAVQGISKMSKRENVQAALKQLETMRTKNIARLIEITEIPAPPFAEEVRAVDMVDRLRKLGLTDVRLDKVGNVIATRKGTDAKSGALALVAHIDTVFPAETDLTVHREGNVYTAPGIGDNSQGLVALLALAEVIQKQKIETKRDILFIGSVGEEGLGDLRGVRALFDQNDANRPNISSMIAIDGGGDNRLVTTAVGSNRYRVTFSGPGGHSYGAFGRAHPHQALAEAISRFTALATPITQEGPKATFSVGRIGGGTSINSIPFTSWMEVDMRSSNQDKLDQLDVVFQQAVKEALDTENAQRQQNDALSVEVQSVGKRPAGANKDGAKLVANAMAAIRSMGFEPQEVASSTDANIPLSLNIPAVTMSRGGIGRNAHAPNESWEDKNTHIALQILLLTTLAEAQGDQ